MSQPNVVNAPRTAAFPMRINPEVKAEAKKVFSQCGPTFTDAVTIFLQQSLNVGGRPFIVASDSREALRNQVFAVPMAEIHKGRDSVRSESDCVSGEEMLAHFGVKQ